MILGVWIRSINEFVVDNDITVSDLVGWWKFDEGSGTVAYDSSGNVHDGNLTNGPTWTNGKIGGALSFDGVDDFVVVNSSPELSLRNNFTLSAWLKINVKVNDSSDQIIIRKGNVDYDFKIYGQNRDLYNRGILEFGGNTGSLYVRWIKSSQSFTNNTWTHVIGIYLKEKLVLNINGQKMKEQTTSGKFGFSSSKLFLGGKTDGSSLFGLIDDVRIYDRALSAAEVQALYNMGQ